MITDVFSLAGVTADELRWAEAPRRHWPCLRANDIGPMELARLGELLGAGSSDDLLREFAFLAGESQESPWVIAIPTRLVGHVVELDDGELDALEGRWAQSLAAGATGPETAPSGYLSDLRQFLSRGDAPHVLYIAADSSSNSPSQGGGA